MNKVLYEFKEDIQSPIFEIESNKLITKGTKLVLVKEKEFVKPQYTSNKIKFTQLSHENGAYDFGDDNVGVDEIYMPFDGKVLYEGYVKKMGIGGKAGEAICMFVESSEEIAEGKKAIIWIWHLSRTLVNKGDILKRNTLIGHEGNTGISFGSHSHVGMAIVPNNYKFNADWNTFKHLKAKYVVDLVDNVYIYPQQKVLNSTLLPKVKNRIKYL